MTVTNLLIRDWVTSRHVTMQRFTSKGEI